MNSAFKRFLSLLYASLAFYAAFVLLTSGGMPMKHGRIVGGPLGGVLSIIFGALLLFCGFYFLNGLFSKRCRACGRTIRLYSDLCPDCTKNEFR